MENFRVKVKELVVYMLDSQNLDIAVIENYTDTIMLVCEEFYKEKVEFKKAQKEAILDIIRFDEDLGLYNED